MIEIKTWITSFLQALQKNFGSRVWFVGLQGSYARGEAKENSDIDLVVILDKLSYTDIRKYNEMLDMLQHRELICGFLSGKTELLNWEVSELFQFYYDTKPIHGSLDVLLKNINSDSINKAIKTGVCNIYHGCVHNMLYEKNNDILYILYKSASFVIQAICFQKTGKYVSHLKELIKNVDESERNILEIFMNIKNNSKINFEEMSEMLFNWSERKLSSIQEYSGKV